MNNSKKLYFNTIYKTVFQLISRVAALGYLTVATSAERQVVFIKIVFY